MKRTEDQKQFEKFIKKNTIFKQVQNGCDVNFLTRNHENNYITEAVKLAFDCWLESKRIWREHGQG